MPLKTILKNFFLGKEDKNSKAPKRNEEQVLIYSPVNGSVVPLEEIADPVFSGGIMGKGCGIIPIDEILCSPVSGSISAVFPTKHAIAITSDEGVELLLHIGVDTVELKGEGFEAYVKPGDHVKKGFPLMKVDNKQLKDKGYDNTIIMIIANTDDYKDIKSRGVGILELGSVLLQIIK